MDSLMMASDKHLDAEWKRIQKKTFTRWCNEHLKANMLKIEELTTDLSDGVKLIVLLELLSQKKLGRYNKKPRVHAQKMENVQLCLDFITKKERIRLVNIGSGDIVGGNLKLILGLIWTLILHYQISIGFGLEDQSKDGPSPKQALLNWINDQIPDREVKNFTSDWNDGTLIANLVDALAPGLCPEHSIMDPKNALQNASHAMKLADDWLDVPQVLAPEDMVNPRVDELSMMTYLSRFPDAKLKPGAPISKKKFRKGDPSKVKVYGPGVEETGLDTNVPAAEFTIDPRNTGDGNVTATVVGPDGPVECVVEPMKNGTYKCTYVPSAEGDYTVSAEFSGVPVGDSPYHVKVAEGGDPMACLAYGPGVEGTDLRCNSPTEFWVETAGAGPGDLGITVRGPRGPISSKDVQMDEEADGKYHVGYTPLQAGPHTVEVTFSNLHIRDSPFRIRVGPDRPDAKKCRAEGPGVEGTDVEIKKETWFDVHTKGAGRGDLSVNIKGPRGTIEAKREPKDKGLDHFTYTPTHSGEHVITIKFGGEQIPGSRFKVQVEPPTDPSKCSAFGPGLAPQGVRVNEPAKFTVRTKDAGHGDVDVKITGPSGEVPFQVEEAPYNYNYTYQASEPGDYVVDIKFAGEHVPNSPFPVAITDATKVSITGPGMGGECLPVNVPLVYKVDARGAGPGNVKCTVQDRGSLKEASPTGDETDSSVGPVVTANDDGTFTIEYTPTNAGMQKMNVTFGEAPIPNTPMKLNIFDASKVKAHGPGLEDGNKSGEQTHFMVDMREAGEGQLQVTVDGPSKTPVNVKDQANNVDKCEYTPTVPGDYVINVQYEGVHIPDSPFKVTVQPPTDPKAVSAYGPGLESPLTTDMWAEFFVNYKNAGEGEPQVTINGPAGGEKVQEEQVEDGLKKYTYYIDPDEAGDYVIGIKFADEEIPNSPFKVHANWKTDPTRVKAYGPGLEGGTTGEWTEFTVDMHQAGEGDLNLGIEGPSEAQVSVEDHEDGTATVKFLPQDAGPYKINIEFAGEAIPSSPFTAVFMAETDVSKVKAYGPGLERNGVKVGDPGDFVIDTREAGTGAVDVVVDGPYWRGRTPSAVTSPAPHQSSATTSSSKSPEDGKPRSRNRGTTGAVAKAKITSNKNDTYDVAYNPRQVGTYKINVFFADEAIPQSPYEVNVTDPSKIILTGPGLTDDGEKCKTVPVISTSNGEPLVWKVDCTEAGPGKLEAVLQGVDQQTHEVKITEEDEDVYRLTFDPEKGGRYRLSLKYSDNNLPQNPIDFSVSNSSLVKVTGPGLVGGHINEKMVIDLDMRDAGEGGLSLSLAGPTQSKMDCDDHKDGTATLSFTPNVAGEYKLSVEFADEHVPGSIFSIPIIDPSKCKASGSGITGDGAKVSAPAEVIVDTRESGPAPIEATVTHPSGETSTVQFSPSDKEGVFVGQYDPKEPGHYQVEVKFADKELADSPFQVPICDPSSVTLAGPGLETAVKDVQNVIDVYTDNAGPGEVEAEIKSVNARAPPVETFVTQVGDNHFQVRYTPRDSSDVEATIKFGGHPVDETKTIPVIDTAKVFVDGPGVKEGIIAREETEFVVDASEAGPSDLVVKVTTPDGDELETTVTEVEPRKWMVKYTPEKAGTHVVNVEYGNKEVEGSPFHPEVCDPTAVKVYGPGLERSITNEVANFTVDASKAGDGNLGLKIEGPEDCQLVVKETPEEGVFDVSYVATRPGVYAIDIKFGDRDVPENPFEMRCERPPPDASKCVLHGLENAGNFTVDCKDAGGSGLLEVGVTGAYVPVEFVSVKHNGDYTFNISYDISEPGETIISVKWHGQHLTGSPFTVETK